MNGNTVSISMTLPGGDSFVQAYSDPFTLSAAVQQELPLFNGEKILRASAEFDGSFSRTFYFTESGKRVSAEELFGKSDR